MSHTWYTNFTKDEQRTMMTLWCIFRSPLMLGTEMPRLDEWTLSLLTNADVLSLLKYSKGAKQIARDKAHAVWLSHDIREDADYVALFNFTEEETKVSVDLSPEGVTGTLDGRELWDGETATFADGKIASSVAAHGAKLWKLTK